MKFIRTLALVLSCVAAPAFAGKAYLDIQPPHDTAVKKGEVELIEFFWFGCIHCYNVDPAVHKLVARLPRNVRFTRIPAVFNDRLAILARGYYTLDALGQKERLSENLFESIHAWGIPMETEQDFIDWTSKAAGVDRKKVSDLYYSDRVKAKVDHARKLSSEYHIDNVPMFVVNGKYITDLVIAGDESALFNTIHTLLAKERK